MNEIVRRSINPEILHPGMSDPWTTFINPTPIPESPETALGRRNPSLAADVLRSYAIDQTAQIGNCRGCSTAESYLGNLSERKLSRLDSVKVSFKRREPNNLSKFFSGKRESFILDIDFNFID